MSKFLPLSLLGLIGAGKVSKGRKSGFPRYGHTRPRDIAKRKRIRLIAKKSRRLNRGKK